MFPLSRAALGAWRRSRAGGSRVGMVPQVIFFFSAFCVEQGEMDAAGAVLLQYDLYTRPSEILNLRGRDIVPAVSAFGTAWGILIGNAEFGETTKTGNSDDVVLTDSPHRAWANTLLKHIGAHMAGLDRKVFNINLAQYENLFRVFSKKFGLRPGLFTPHVIRHSGPSFDLINEHRSFEAIQARGRWATSQSASRYRKPGRLLMTAAKLPPKFRAYTEAPLQQALQRLLIFSWAKARALWSWGFGLDALKIV